jgi:hypothetical protein
VNASCKLALALALVQSKLQRLQRLQRRRLARLQRRTPARRLARRLATQVMEMGLFSPHQRPTR